MAIGTALAIAGLASAGGSLFKGVTQAKAAKAAAKEQTAAAQQAQDYYTQGMNQLGQLYGPYINSGAGAIGTIGRLTTPGPGAKFASPGPPNATPMVGGPSVPPGARPPNGAPPIGMAQPRAGGPMPGTPPPMRGPQMPGQGPGAPPMGTFGSMASSMAPQFVQMADGQVRPLPPQMAQSYIASGMARPVQGPYPQAEGGDYHVNGPTLFLAGEAGPERASFSGAQGVRQAPQGMQPPQGWGGFAGMLPPGMSRPRSMMGSPGGLSAMSPRRAMGSPQGLARGPSMRSGALQGGMQGGPAAAGANALPPMPSGFGTPLPPTPQGMPPGAPSDPNMLANPYGFGISTSADPYGFGISTGGDPYGFGITTSGGGLPGGQ